MRWTLQVWIGAIGMSIVIAACASQTAAPVTTPLPPISTLDPVRVQRGKELYQANCATCHGAPNWATPGPDGLYPAPPHDDRGHTWHHSDRVLYETISSGMGDPLKPDSPLRMPAWGDKLSDVEIRAAIEYFKSLWTEENRLLAVGANLDRLRADADAVAVRERQAAYNTKRT